MSQLVIRNFGAIRNADIEVKKYNFFIGHTSSGKSTVAKLISIFNSFSFWTINNGNFNQFEKLLEKYNIKFDFDSNTLIEYSKDKFHWIIAKDKFETNNDDADLMLLSRKNESYEFILKFIEKKSNEKKFKALTDGLKSILEGHGFDEYFNSVLNRALLTQIYEDCIPIYIPAERSLITTFSNSIFTLLQAGASIPDCIKDFGSMYEKARGLNPKVNIDFLNIDVVFSKDGDSIFLKDEKKPIKLSQASSGIQSVIPMWTVLNQYLNKRERKDSIINKEKQFIIIEEPELNLFPTSQYQLVDWIMKKMKGVDGSIVITTHSPYVLSTVDNLIFAHDILRRKTRIVYEDIKSIIPSLSLVNFEDVSSYFFHIDGTVKDIRDIEIKSLGSQYIDEASNELGRIFDKLCEIDRDEL